MLGFFCCKHSVSFMTNNLFLPFSVIFCSKIDLCCGIVILQCVTLGFVHNNLPRRAVQSYNISVCNTRNVSGIDSILGIKLVNLPTRLTFTSEIDTTGCCYSTLYRSNGDLLLGCNDGVRLFDRTTRKVSYYEFVPNYGVDSSVAEFKRNIFILQKHGDSYRMMEYMANSSHGLVLFELIQSEPSPPLFAVSEKYLTVASHYQSAILLFDFDTKRLQTVFRTDDKAKGMTFLRGDLLCVYHDRVCKYRLKGETPTTIWTCGGLASARNVCTDDDGLIYVSTSKKIIYIISPQGTYLLLKRYF